MTLATKQLIVVFSTAAMALSASWTAAAWFEREASFFWPAVVFLVSFLVQAAVSQFVKSREELYYSRIVQTQEARLTLEAMDRTKLAEQYEAMHRTILKKIEDGDTADVKEWCEMTKTLRQEARRMSK